MPLNPNLPIIALDFDNRQELEDFLKLLPQEPLNLKIGMEMYYLAGLPLVQDLVARGHQIFLDLKLHDIPNTLKRAMKILAQSGVAMVNLHAAGGSIMMQAAKEALIQGTPAGQTPPLLIAVTQLTSTSQDQLNQEQLIPGTMEDCVKAYAQLTYQAGLDGVVCSPREASLIKEVTAPNFLTVTPGIRPFPSENKDDQVRIATIEQAIQNACDFLVIGRPITRAQDPATAYLTCVEKLQNARKQK